MNWDNKECISGKGDISRRERSVGPVSESPPDFISATG